MTFASGAAPGFATARAFIGTFGARLHDPRCRWPFRLAGCAFAGREGKLRTDRPVPCSDQRIPEHFILC